jgi:hypothetical protein
MGLARAVQGARYTGQLITWLQEDGGDPGLTGGTITGVIRNAAGTSTAITGTLSVVSSTSFTWAYSVADIATPANFQVQFKSTHGGSYDLTFPEPWIVEPAL